LNRPSRCVSDMWYVGGSLGLAADETRTDCLRENDILGRLLEEDRRLEADAEREAEAEAPMEEPILNGDAALVLPLWRLFENEKPIVTASSQARIYIRIF
jgi:hypothetical protein